MKRLAPLLVVGQTEITALLWLSSQGRATYTGDDLDLIKMLP